MTSSLHYQNAELVYRTGGQEGAPTIVLLHGGLGSMEDFAPLLPRLQQQFRTVEIDTRGHGLSTRGDAPLTYAQIADDVRHIVDAIGLAAFHLFGFSDGGTAAYRIAAEDGRVQSVLTVGAQWHSRDTPRDMFENLTVADMREHMPRRLLPTKNATPNLIFPRWLPICAACGWMTRPRAFRMNRLPASGRPCWRCVVRPIFCCHSMPCRPCRRCFPMRT